MTAFSVVEIKYYEIVDYGYTIHINKYKFVKKYFR